MAGKQLGKLRQWAGEVISVRDKTIVSDEFKELEHDIELRRQGLWKLHVASEDFHRRLIKKAPCEALEDTEKYSAIDALGIVMIQHGEEFGGDSAFGTSLVALGKAHSKVATLQESFALNFEETYIASLQRAEDDIKEYQAQRKKMESRRLALDAAITKVEKTRNSKKEKEKTEAEDEYEVAKSRYEEMTEDVRARMVVIQENEIEQLRDLTAFLDTEIQYVEQYLHVLQEAKSEWIDDATLSQMEQTREARPPPLPTRPTDESRLSSIRAKRPASRARSTISDAAGSSDEDSEPPTSRLQRSSSIKSASSRPPSRPQSRAERKRVDSLASVMTEKGEKKEKEKEKAEKAASKKMSIGGWASSISKMTGRSKKEHKKLDPLMADQDDMDEDEADSPAAGSKSSSRPSSPSKPRIKGNTPTASPQVPARILKPPSQQGKKIAVALHDFAAASNDELSFKAGDQIVVVNEVIDGWWMGEHNSTGKTGLFPTTYTEILNTSTSSLASKPLLPRRPSGTTLPPSISRSSPDSSPTKTKGKPPPIALKQNDVDAASISSDVDHPFGDNYIAASRSPLYGGFYDRESVTSDAGPEEDDDKARLVKDDEDSDDGLHVYRAQNAPPPPPARRLSIPSSKKAPPPPPPRRTTMSASSTLAVPPRPGISRSNLSSRTNSTNNSFVSVTDIPQNAGDVDGEEFTSSPFDNPTDGCGSFKQNPFKPKGYCSNCFQMHSQ